MSARELCNYPVLSKVQRKVLFVFTFLLINCLLTVLVWRGYQCVTL